MTDTNHGLFLYDGNSVKLVYSRVEGESVEIDKAISGGKIIFKLHSFGAQDKEIKMMVSDGSVTSVYMK